MISWRSRLRTIPLAACGVLLLWLSIGNIAGASLAVSYLEGNPHTGVHRCIPYSSVFGVIETDCENPFAKEAWAFGVEIPRMVIVPAAMTYVLVRASVKSSFDLHYLLEASWWALLSIPFIAVAVFGFWFWHKWSPLSAFAITIPLFYIVMGLGLHE